MLVLRKRLIFWLIKEYFKKWRKAIFLFFIFGLFAFFLLRTTLGYIITKIPVGQKESIGLVGAYTIDTLPQSILQDVSKGLTFVSSDGIAKPALAKSWKIEQNDTKYIFTLQKGVFFSDAAPFTSESVSYNFADTVVERPNDYTIIFKLKEKYTPFLITVSHPIFKPGFIGIGEYKVKDVMFNGNFVASLTLASVKNQYVLRTYHFYPTHDALKTAFVLGEVSRMYSLPDQVYKTTVFASFPNVHVKKNINYSQLVTLFYNTQDPILSDDKVRNALSYALPDEFSEGKRNYTPFSPFSFAYTKDYTKSQDTEHAKLLLDASQTARRGGGFLIQLKTLSRYNKTAQNIAKLWKQIHVEAKIEEVDSIPSQFQVFLGDYSLPKDPDQYVLWHQNQENNISHYKNLRIDKLLEDGRKTIDLETRKKIYADFQKYLLSDSPAAFLYFPYEYEVVRK